MQDIEYFSLVLTPYSELEDFLFSLPNSLQTMQNFDVSGIPSIHTALQVEACTKIEDEEVIMHNLKQIACCDAGASPQHKVVLQSFGFALLSN